MSVILENLNINHEMNLFISDVVRILCSLNQGIETIPPTINFVYIGDLSTDDMKMVTIMDNSSILQFVKIVPQKTNETILLHVCYCIAKRFCSFLDYETGSIIDDSIFELYKVNKDYVLSKFYFGIDDTAVDLDELDSYEGVNTYYVSTGALLEENKISNIIDDDISTKVGYYIRSESLQYVHCFKKQNVAFDKEVDNDAIESIYKEYETDEELTNREYIENISVEIVNYLINNVKQGVELKELIGFIGKSEKIKAEPLKPQEVNIKVATFVSQVLRSLIFNLPENI